MLTLNERKVLEMRYGLGSHTEADGLTLVEIAKRLGISAQRASQLESSALAKVRSALLARGITSVNDVA